MAMLYTSSREIKLQTTYSKALYISVAYDDTIVAVYIRNKNTYFAHFSKQGELLKQKDISSLSTSFGMMTDQSFSFISVANDSITTINLKDYSFHSIAHDFSKSKEEYVFLEYFYETRLICVVYIKGPKNNHLRLTYYRHSYQKSIKALAIYDSEENDWKFECILKKGNNYSLILWFLGEQSKYFQFRTFELIDQSSGEMKHYKIKRDVETHPLQISVSDAWEAADNSIVAVFCCESNKKTEIFTSYLIADRTHLTVQEENTQLADGILRDSDNLGSFSILVTQLLPNKHQGRVPIFIYFDNETKKVLMRSNEFYYDYKSYHREQMVLYKSNYHQFREFKIKVLRIMRSKEIALHFMLHINEDFDDDLLQDAISLLDLE